MHLYSTQRLVTFLKPLTSLELRDKYDFKPETPRRGVLPKRVIIQKKMLEEEKNRLEALKESEKPLVDAAARPIVVAQ